ncbi:MAG: hypothetical protein GYB53_18265 [Rhodobacteraceae bacterium]|nr:hypothetical protein [Paracoccaceae bacterium]
MGKLHVNHRIVIRNAAGKILEDHPFRDFASARPAFDDLVAGAEPGEWIALQHGVRIIMQIGEPDQ